jgi:hypothetical protein
MRLVEYFMLSNSDNGIAEEEKPEHRWDGEPANEFRGPHADAPRSNPSTSLFEKTAEYLSGCLFCNRSKRELGLHVLGLFDVTNTWLLQIESGVVRSKGSKFS